MTDKIYHLIFVSRNGRKSNCHHFELYKDALSAFRKYAVPETANNYFAVSLIEHDQRTDTERILAALVFDPADNGTCWRDWQVGRPVIYSGSEYDGCFYFEGIVTEKYEDHLIVEADGMHLWVDDITVELFS